MSEEQVQKYSYKFRLEAKLTAPSKDEASQAELQSYINEVLGIKPLKRPEQPISA